jgi:hypothetical protein
MRNNNARLEAAALVFVVFVLGLLLGGVGSHLWDEHVQGNGRPTAQINTKPTRDQVINSLTQRLRLTPDQQKQVIVVIDDTRAKWQALYASGDAEHEQIRQQARASIRAVLTPDQQVEYDDYMRQMDEQRKKDAAR